MEERSKFKEETLLNVSGRTRKTSGKVSIFLKCVQAQAATHMQSPLQVHAVKRLGLC